MLEASEEQYIAHYIRGESIRINRGMALGKEIADSLESGEDTGDIMKDLVVSMLPKFECMDHDYHETIEVKGVKIPLFSKLDSATKDLASFYEYKTGATPWNQKMADQHGQITFYCVIAYQRTGKIPHNIKLIHAPTRKTPDGKVELTGEIREYTTKRMITDILKMKIRMHKAWKRIEEIENEQLI